MLHSFSQFICSVTALRPLMGHDKKLEFRSSTEINILSFENRFCSSNRKKGGMNILFILLLTYVYSLIIAIWFLVDPKT